MFTGRHLKAITAWIASFALLMSALVPALSHAFLADVPGNWVEVCSVTGAKLVQADAGNPNAASSGKAAPGAPEGHAFKHCPYCASHADLISLPPADSSGMRLITLGQHVPELFLAAPRPLFAWASARPRAPPLNT